MVKKSGIVPMMLDPDKVEYIHQQGGSILSSSRGAQEPSEMVDFLTDYGVNILFAIGGDGTLRGAHKIALEVEKRGLQISVIGIPKTIDNDIMFVEKTFGFETAFSKAVESIETAHVESKGAPNGIGLVRLMGRDSGFIAASATIASLDVNYLLIPEIPFDLEGERGLLALLKRRLEHKSHAVIVVAEGAGQACFEKDKYKDASGNVVYGDIGLYLRDEIKKHFDSIGFEVNIKYIDPSYIIRSSPPLPNDAVFCTTLAQNAVHAGMSGKTDMMVGMWNSKFTHVPLEIVIGKRKKIDPESHLWLNVIASTGQPAYIGNNPQILTCTEKINRFMR